jgi:hypothetical protein
MRPIRRVAPAVLAHGQTVGHAASAPLAPLLCGAFRLDHLRAEGRY